MIGSGPSSTALARAASLGRPKGLPSPKSCPTSPRARAPDAVASLVSPILPSSGPRPATPLQPALHGDRLFPHSVVVH
jgi:hypothetical protein